MKKLTIFYPNKVFNVEIYIYCTRFKGSYEYFNITDESRRLNSKTHVETFGTTNFGNPLLAFVKCFYIFLGLFTNFKLHFGQIRGSCPYIDQIYQ
jgi:hypothetical protein